MKENTTNQALQSILLTFEIDHPAGPFERPDRLLVRRVPQILPIDGQDGVTDVQAFRVVCRHAAEYFRNEYRHPVFAPALDRDAETVVVRFDDTNLGLGISRTVIELVATV